MRSVMRRSGKSGGRRLRVRQGRWLAGLLLAGLWVCWARVGEAAPRDGSVDPPLSDPGQPASASKPAVAPSPTLVPAGAAGADSGAVAPSLPAKPAAPAAGGPAAKVNAVGGATGDATPAVGIQEEQFALGHRLILPDEELVLRMTHPKDTKSIRIDSIELYYAAESTVSQSGSQLPVKKEEMRALPLTAYQSLDAATSAVHIGLRRLCIDKGGHDSPPSLPLWEWDYALLKNQPATLLITYRLIDNQDRSASEPRQVTLHLGFTNRWRGVFWGVLGLLVSVLITILVGVGCMRRRAQNKDLPPLSGSERFWYVVLGVTLNSQNRFSLSALQVVIWTHIAAFSLSYVWTMTGDVVNITPQMLMLLGIGGATAVLSRVGKSEVAPDLLELVPEERTASLRDLVSSTDTPSIFKFQMLIFTLLAAGIVTWEITNSYVFPELPNTLIALMGLSNTTYLLGSVSGNSPENSVRKDLDQAIKELDARIASWNQGLVPEEQAKRWSRSTLIARFLGSEAGAAALPPDVVTILSQIQSNLGRLFA